MTVQTISARPGRVTRLALRIGIGITRWAERREKFFADRSQGSGRIRTDLIEEAVQRERDSTIARASFPISY